MILEGFGETTREDGSHSDFNLLVDNIREVSINEDLIDVLLRDNTKNAFRKDDKSIDALYLLNDEGKTLKKLI